MAVARNLVLLSLCLAALPALSVGAQPTPDPSPGLYVQLGTTTAPLPLVETKVRGEVDGFVARVKVTQAFVNPFDDFIEATYVFPLSERAAVHAMTMHLADRDVVAQIERRKEAERIYDEAVRAGQTAALLDQERPNLFTQKVGNIPPGDVVEVELTYVEALPYDGGVSSFAFPTVVGPRYIPGTPLPRPDSATGDHRSRDTDRVPEASRITPPALAEHESSPHRIDLELVLRPGMDIQSLSSPSHELEIERPYDDEATVRIARTDTVPDKDFILQVDLRGERAEVAVLAHRPGGGPGYATLAIQPPALAEHEVQPKDLFFVVDNSGSMHGAPLAAAKALVVDALEHMNPDDRFTIMRFSDDVSSLSDTPLANTPDNVTRGVAFIGAMEGMGGTEMLSGVRRALGGKPDAGRVRVVFFLTDGYIGNDDEILRAVVEDNDADARLFSLGVGSSVNRYLLGSMARLGRGEMQVMRHDAVVEPFVERFYRRVRNPVLTDVEVSFEGLSVRRDATTRLPDLFDAQPLLVHARYDTPGEGHVVVRGRVAGKPHEQRIPVTLPAVAQRPAIASLWAREQIARYDDDEAVRPGTREREITDLALSHSLMSRYTSFVAVDREISRPAHRPLIPVAQRLPLPEGVSRRALGHLSRREIPPGDPFLDVAAPADATRVTAYFPFGLVQDLVYDPRRELWRTRFLVPEGIADGHYSVQLAIELVDGSVLHASEPFHLDSQVADFNVSFDEIRVRAGRGALIEVDSVEPAEEVYVHSEALAWDRVELLPDEARVDWQRFLRVGADMTPGRYTAEVVVRDRAGNRFAREVTIEVYDEAERCAH